MNTIKTAMKTVLPIAALLALPLTAMAGDYSTPARSGVAPTAQDKAAYDAQEKAAHEAAVDRTAEKVQENLSDSGSLTGPSGPTTNGSKIISRQEAERIRGEKPVQKGSSNASR